MDADGGEEDLHNLMGRPRGVGLQKRPRPVRIYTLLAATVLIVGVIALCGGLGLHSAAAAAPPAAPEPFAPATTTASADAREAKREAKRGAKAVAHDGHGKAGVKGGKHAGARSASKGRVEPVADKPKSGGDA